jgi:hypothetical protein
MPQGSIGTIEAYNDFTSFQGDLTWAAGQVDLGGGWGMVSKEEGSINELTDESGGVLQFLTDTGDNDNVALTSGPYDPSKGPLVVEARIKVSGNVTRSAMWVGLTETMAVGDSVFPITTSGTTLTYTGSGGMVGLLWDPDRTTNAWLAVAGDGGSASNTAVFPTDGTAATNVAVTDEFDVIRVELYPSGFAKIFHDEELVDSGQTSLTTTDLFYAVVMCENRTAANEEFEVDYVYCSAVRDWTV